MKLFLAFALLLLASFSSAKIAVTVFNSIEEFKVTNPKAKLIEMDLYVHQLDDSRSYTAGARQTGKKKKFKRLSKKGLDMNLHHFRRRCRGKLQRQKTLGDFPERHNNLNLSFIGWQRSFSNLRSHQL